MMIRNTLFPILVFAFSVSAFSQSKYWDTVLFPQSRGIVKTSDSSDPDHYTILSLDLTAFAIHLQQAPNRNTVPREAGLIVEFPDQNGRLSRYKVQEASILHSDLAAKYPDIKSYAGVSLENTSVTIRFSVTPSGFHGMILGMPQGTIYIDPYSKDKQYYMAFAKKDLQADLSQFRCQVQETVQPRTATKGDTYRQRNANDGILRKYRLALACTGEYAQFHSNAGDTDADKKTDILIAMNTTMTRVNGIYEKELSITMEIVVGNDALIFLDPATDGLSNNNALALINESQAICDNTIGSANYDIGHTFSTGAGGLAGLGVVCRNGRKASGVTGRAAPVGDPYDVDYVAHEFGHQFGAPHTFNSTTAGGCTTGTVSPSTAFEPGSGSTIMAYAGICAPQNVQNNSDDYFHAISLHNIYDYISSTSCGTLTNISNTAPTANAGSDHTIPYGTAFILEGESTDPDGDALTYAWEQMDNEQGAVPIVSTATQGPMFRSIPPSTAPDRYMPSLPAVIAGNLAPTWGVIPTVARTMNFRLTVRDNNAAGGQNNSDDMVVTVANTGPFLVTAPNTAVTWAANSTQTVTWDVAGTTANGINATDVIILLSTDGGYTYTNTIATVPNTGTANITVPNLPGTTNRIMIRGSGNIFYDISNTDFTIIGQNNCMAIVPTGLTVSTITDTTAEISWNLVTDATYDLRYRKTGDTNWTEVSVTSPTYQLTGLDPATEYEVQIQSKCPDNSTSGYTSSETFITLAPVCNATVPTEVSVPLANVTTTTALVSWTTVPNATYMVQYKEQNATNWIDLPTTTTPVTLTGLTLGTTYLVRISSVCGGNQSAYSISVVFTTLTTNPVFVPIDVHPIGDPNSNLPLEELAKDILIGGCAGGVTDIKAISGSTPNYGNSYGYFTYGGTTDENIEHSFPLKKGILLTSGSASEAEGPNERGNFSFGDASWTGDSDLKEILDDRLENSFATFNATSITFTFVPVVDEISFDYVFASDEYEDNSCFENSGNLDYQDGFAFIIKGPGITPDRKKDNTLFAHGGKNIALIPGTNLPVSAKTIYDNPSSNCIDPNSFPELYVSHWSSIEKQNKSPIEFDGRTTLLTASAKVIPGEKYTLKLVIADRGDHQFDGGVFIQNSIFGDFDVDLGPDINTCAQQTTLTAQGVFDSSIQFEWQLDGIPIPNENTKTLTTTQSGTYTVIVTGGECPGEDEIKVNLSGGLQVGPVKDLEACADQNGQAVFDLTVNDALATNGQTGLTVTYYTTETNADNGVNPIANPTSYTVTSDDTIYVRIDDGNGCSGADGSNFTVTITALDVDMSITQQACSGEAILTATGTFSTTATYVWELDGNPLTETSNTLTATASGDYTLTVTDGCAGSVTKTVTITNALVVDMTVTQQSCSGEATLTAVGTFSTGATYAWELDGNVIPNETSDTLLAIASGDYTLTVTDGCTGSVTKTVTITSALVVQIDEDQTACSGEATLTAVGTFSTGATYAWELDDNVIPNETSDTLLATASGDYTLTVTDGCSGSVTKTVTVTNALVVDMTVTQQSCSGEATLAAVGTFSTGATYAWQLDGNPLTETSNTLTANASGDYTLTVTDGCAGSVTKTVTITNALVVQIDEDQTACSGEATLTAVGTFNTGATYAWELDGNPLPETSNTLLAIASGDYTLTVTDGCTGRASQNVRITSQPEVTILDDIEICRAYELPVILNGTYYTGSNATGTQLDAGTEIYNSQTVYIYAGTPECNNESSFVITILEETPLVISAQSVQAFSENNRVVIEVEQTGTYEYSLDNGFFQDNNIFEDLSPGTHRITVCDTAGCGCDTIEICIMGYPKYFTPNGDGIHDTWSLNTSGCGTIEIENLYIFNRFGKLIKVLQPGGAGWDGTYNGKRLFSADYWFKVVYKENGVLKEFTSNFSLMR
ncbi:choice-of-anchor L domain-containing protein [Aquimarina sp. AU58]|uniref:choice-of-anchor L domain-containing protein n=1 Tax=Aquimarina sp. AU58 TaxID=1874112 RepID=UPI000D646323|nr:choice-of-anchor L domain-containing protein [Aquimarina sp. AU58]